MNLESNIKKYYLFTFLDMFTIYLPYLVYYFQELGFSLGKIAILQSAFALTLILLEIPSGYIADKLGRKNSLIFSAVVQALSIFILFTAKSFEWLIISHVCVGISTSFLSGANSAFLYDTLLSLKKENLYKKIQGKANFFGEIAVIISSLIAAGIIQFGFKNLVFYTLIGHIILIFITLSFKEPKRHKPIEKIPFYKELILLFSIIKRSLYNKKLLGLFSYSFIVLGISNLIFIMYQPYFRATGLNLSSYAIIFAVFSVVCGFFALKADYIEKKLGIFKSLLLMPIFLVLTLLGVSTFFIQIGFIFFFFREAVRGFVFPILEDYINKITNSNERATVLSIGSMFSRLGFIVIATSFGVLSDNYGLRLMFFITGIGLLTFTMIIAGLLKRKQ